MTRSKAENVIRHVAIIMDGNGRWAQRRGLPRSAGHARGAEAARLAAGTARDAGVEFLTLYAFSTENWSRPTGEIDELFHLVRRFLRRYLADLHRQNCRIRIIGERRGLPDDVAALFEEAERLTADDDGRDLLIAFNYGGRDEIASAARSLARDAVAGRIDPEGIDAEMMESRLRTHGVPDPDLIIRTGEEKRLSNFLLWQSAYSELFFSDALWPDFSEKHFREAMDAYHARKRRFGGVGEDEVMARETAS